MSTSQPAPSVAPLTLPTAGVFAPDVVLTDPAHDPLASLLQAAHGRYAVCRIGYVGRITGRAWMPWGRWAWVGVSCLGRPWSSGQPCLLDPAQDRALDTIF